MTDRERVLERLRSANPLPGIDHVDADELGLFVSYFEERRDRMADTRTTRGHEPKETQHRWARPVLVFMTALAVCLVVVGAAALLMRGEESSVEPAAPTTVPPVGTTVPATTVADPPVTTPSVDEPPPPEDADVVPEAAFDYASIGETVGTLDTAFGTLSWYKTSSLSGELLEAGLPGPSKPQPDYDLRGVFARAPCCLEVFEGADGYLGLGAAGGPDEPRVITGYLGNLWRVRGVETAGEFQHLWDTNVLPDGLEVWGDRWYLYPDYSKPIVYGEFSFTPGEVWFSADGSTWEQRADSPFGTDVAMVSQPDSVAEHDGTWMVLGWSGVEDLADVADPFNAVGATGAAWMSDDLKTWTLVPFEFGSPGVDTTLLYVVAGDGGWMIIGERIPQETPAIHESVIWISPDGLAWSELPMGDVTGLPYCVLDRQREDCLSGFSRAGFTPDGIVLYVDRRGGDQSSWGWQLWIGVWED
jgi:hypothetical protein